MIPTVAIAELATRTGAVVCVTAAPWPADRTLVSWIVSVQACGTICTGASTSIETALAQCAADVDRALGAMAYPKSQEG